MWSIHLHWNLLMKKVYINYLIWPTNFLFLLLSVIDTFMISIMRTCKDVCMCFFEVPQKLLLSPFRMCYIYISFNFIPLNVSDLLLWSFFIIIFMVGFDCCHLVFALLFVVFSVYFVSNTPKMCRFMPMHIFLYELVVLNGRLSGVDPLCPIQVCVLSLSFFYETLALILKTNQW